MREREYPVESINIQDYQNELKKGWKNNLGQSLCFYQPLSSTQVALDDVEMLYEWGTVDPEDESMRVQINANGLRILLQYIGCASGFHIIDGAPSGITALINHLNSREYRAYAMRMTRR